MNVESSTLRMTVCMHILRVCKNRSTSHIKMKIHWKCLENLFINTQIKLEIRDIDNVLLYSMFYTNFIYD